MVGCMEGLQKKGLYRIVKCCYFLCSVCRKVSEGVSHRFTLFYAKRKRIVPSCDIETHPLEQRFKTDVTCDDAHPQNDDIRLNVHVYTQRAWIKSVAE